MSTTERFVKLQRTLDAEYLFRDPNAFTLLSCIAFRAWYTRGTLNPHGLTFGQAMLGDWREVGLSQKEYRCAKDRLVKKGLASFRGTKDGTIATLLDSRVYSIADERKTPKNGDQKGERFSEEKRNIRANERANEGRSEGDRGATKETGRQVNGETGVNINPAEKVSPTNLSLFEAEAAPAPKETHQRNVIPPTPEQVTAYSLSVGYPMDGEVWCDSYAQKGWMVGKAKMRDWQAAVRNWKASGWTAGKPKKEEQPPGDHDMIEIYEPARWRESLSGDAMLGGYARGERNWTQLNTRAKWEIDSAMRRKSAAHSLGRA
jgi:hypothetical protein